jgi:hypothetical protein
MISVYKRRKVVSGKEGEEGMKNKMGKCWSERRLIKERGGPGGGRQVMALVCFPLFTANAAALREEGFAVAGVSCIRRVWDVDRLLQEERNV